MSSLPNPAVPAPASSQPVVVPNMQGQAPSNAAKPQPTQEQNKSNEAWDSELQLVSSLSKLQQLEAQIHQLRTLLPDRLLAPLVPIVSPEKIVPNKTMPGSPQVLYAQLSQAARAGVAEVEQFQALWRSPEMKVIWDHVEEEIKKDGGKLLQPTGMWERDYDVLLEELVKGEREKEESRRKEEEEADRSKAQSTAANWRMDVEKFAQKGVPGVRVLPDKQETSIIIGLLKAGMVFQARPVNESEGNILEWRVSNVEFPTKPITKLETAICNCLNSRPRQWDLAYLLDMISSYADVKQTPCVKCNKMTDNAAQLPTLRIRRIATVRPLDGREIMPWEAFHAGCV